MVPYHLSVVCVFLLAAPGSVNHGHRVGDLQIAVTVELRHAGQRVWCTGIDVPDPKIPAGVERGLRISSRWRSSVASAIVPPSQNRPSFCGLDEAA
jgi:hypothetical protein